LLASALGAVVRIYRALIDAFSRLLRLNAGFEDELRPTPRPLWWLNAAAVAVTIAATALAYEEGLDRGMHRVAPDSVEALAQTIGIHLSQRHHGTQGYVGRYEILETLFNGGLTGRQSYLDKLGIAYPANVEMADRMNEVIQNAAALRDLPTDATFSNRRLYAPEANDPGYVDYVSWSFDLFGTRLEALYYFYFLILSAAIALYIICFRADALPLVVLATAMVAFLILVGSRAFDSVLLRTVHNQRFLGTLCMVSYLHLLFTILIYRKPTLSRVLATALQTGLFVFVMFTRSSAFWMVVSLAVIIGLHVVLRLGRPRQEPRTANAARLALSWPVLMLVGGVAGSLVYKSAVLHPIYGIGVFLPYHMIWHNAYMGMGLHPDWKERGDKHKGQPIPDQGTDNMAWLAAAAEAEDRYGLAEVETINTTVGGLAGIKMALHEKLIKERFLRFALHNPRFMLEVYLWYKPKWLLREFVRTYGNYGWKLPALLCMLAFFIVAAAAWRRLEIPPQVRATPTTMLLVSAVMSLAAPFWAYPLHHVMGEAFFIWMMVLLYFATLLLSKAWSIVRPVAQLRV
jgi:hypothetical protein